MEKKTLVKIILGTIGGLIFALGMCCCLLPEWNLFSFGLGLAIGMGCGIVGLLVDILVFPVYSYLKGGDR